MIQNLKILAVISDKLTNFVNDALQSDSLSNYSHYPVHLYTKFKGIFTGKLFITRMYTSARIEANLVFFVFTEVKKYVTT